MFTEQHWHESASRGWWRLPKRWHWRLPSQTHSPQNHLYNSKFINSLLELNLLLQFRSAEWSQELDRADRSGPAQHPRPAAGGPRHHHPAVRPPRVWRFLLRLRQDWLSQRGLPRCPSCNFTSNHFFSYCFNKYWFYRVLKSTISFSASELCACQTSPGSKMSPRSSSTASTGQSASASDALNVSFQSHSCLKRGVEKVY